MGDRALHNQAYHIAWLTRDHLKFSESERATYAVSAARFLARAGYYRQAMHAIPENGANSDRCAIDVAKLCREGNGLNSLPVVQAVLDGLRKPVTEKYQKRMAAEWMACAKSVVSGGRPKLIQLLRGRMQHILRYPDISGAPLVDAVKKYREDLAGQLGWPAQRNIRIRRLKPRSHKAA